MFILGLEKFAIMKPDSQIISSESLATGTAPRTTNYRSNSRPICQNPWGTEKAEKTLVLPMLAG
jgi:hypothetical protein